MNTINSIQQMKEYCSPQIERIKLDNEISLALESEPPAGPSESILRRTDSFDNNPFFTNIT